MNTQEIEFRRVALLCMQRALWRRVTPDLRSVSIGRFGDQVRGRFVYDGPIDDKLRDLVADAKTEVAIDLPDGVQAEFVLQDRPTGPRELEEGEWWVYLRRKATDE